MHDPTDEAIAGLQIPTGVKAAGWITMATGGFLGGLAIQTALIFRMTSSARAVVAAMGVFAIVGIVLGWRTTRGQSGSTIAAAVVSAAVLLLSGGWAIVSLLSGVVSPLTVWVVACALVSTAACILAIGPAMKVTAARAALRARGLDFGA